jgi:deoxyribonuclease V
MIRHPWNVDYEKAIEIQNSLKEKVILKVSKAFNPHFVAGVDVSCDEKRLYAATVLFSFPELVFVEKNTASGEVSFPYIPGFLSFREAPIIIKTIKGLKEKPDIILVDGQGIAHPRRLGLAAHIGVLMDIASIGCAKKKLVGSYKPVPDELGAYTPLIDGEQVIGFVIRTKKHVKPVFVSPGHLMDFKASYNIVMACLHGYRLPEPTRLAHIEANRERRNRN